MSLFLLIVKLGEMMVLRENGVSLRAYKSKVLWTVEDEC